MLCPQCGFKLADSARFCTRCGASTSSSEINTPVTQRTARLEDPDSNQPPAGAGLYAGRIIDDKYKIEGLLGSGGMGAVYRATRVMIGDTVAIKVLHKELVSDPQAIERFRREAQAAARLKHPNAVLIYDFGVSSDNLVYLVMETVEGQTLRSIIRQQIYMSPSDAAVIITQICAALDEAHRQNIVHRDLKPDNIIVTESRAGMRVKVLDFGIAKLRDLSASASTLTQDGTVMGTPYYMSPEQCMGEEVDGRSDVYALGIILYEMLAGRVPFNSSTPTAVIIQHVNQMPVSLREISGDIPHAVEKVCMHALAKSREARPQSAGEFATELNDAVRQGDQPLPVAPPVVSPMPFGAQGGAAPGLAPTIQVQQQYPVNHRPADPYAQPYADVLATPGSGNQAAYATARKRSVSAVVIALLLLVVAGGAVAVYLLTKTGVSPKESILQEIRKGNLVKPEGASAYDLYQKHAAALAAQEKTEVTNLASPQLEKRGSEIINRLKQEEPISEADWAEAVRVYSWLNDLKPGPTAEARKHFSSGRLALEKKDYNKALTDFQRSVQLEPRWAMSFNGVARAYIGLKDNLNADLHYGKAIEIEPDWIVLWINRSALQLDMNDPKAAERYILRAIAIDPERASAHRLYGVILDKQNRNCDALREYQMAIDKAPTDPYPAWMDAARQRVAAIRSRYSCP